MKCRKGEEKVVILSCSVKLAIFQFPAYTELQHSTFGSLRHVFFLLEIRVPDKGDKGKSNISERFLHLSN